MGQQWRATAGNRHLITIGTPVPDRDDAWLVSTRAHRVLAVLTDEIEHNYALVYEAVVDAH